MKKKPLKCSDAGKLIRMVEDEFDVVEIRDPAVCQKQLVLADGLFINIFRNKTVNFQGKDPTGNTVKALERVLEEVNAM